MPRAHRETPGRHLPRQTPEGQRGRKKKKPLVFTVRGQSWTWEETDMKEKIWFLELMQALCKTVS